MSRLITLTQYRFHYKYIFYVWTVYKLTVFYFSVLRKFGLKSSLPVGLGKPHVVQSRDSSTKGSGSKGGLHPGHIVPKS